MMIIDDEQRKLHWRRSVALMMAALFIIGCLAIIGPIAAESLGKYAFLRFPLGFFIVAHGIVIGIIAVVYWFIAGQEAADRNYNIITHA